MKICLVFLSLFFVSGAHADFFFDPHATVGFNTVQGTNFRLGLDLGYRVDQNLRFGVGAYYAFGEKPQYDREIGAGPFVAYVVPITDFLLLSAREDVDYVDARVPLKPDGYERETGVLSATSVGAHVFFTPNFVVSGGYRVVLALANSALDEGRSGAFFGFAFGI